MLSCWITGFGQLTTPSVLALVCNSFKRPLTLVLRSCWSRLSRTKQTEMTTLRFTRLHLKTGQKRHSDAAGENQNTTNSKDSKCRNGSCVNFLLCSFQLLVWDENRRHHGRILFPTHCDSSKCLGVTVAIMAGRHLHGPQGVTVAIMAGYPVS